MNKATEINPPERSRTYFFKDFDITVCDVCQVSISDSGTHRLKTMSGEHVIVKPEWYVIKLDIDEWSF